MPRLYMRITAHQDAADSVMAAIGSLDCVERVEEVADLMPQWEEDSSSADAPGDVGPGMHSVEVEVPHLHQTERVRQVAEDAARRYAATVEFVEEL